MNSTSWTQLVVPVSPEELELVADRLWAHHPVAIEETIVDGAPVLVTGFASVEVASAARAALVSDGRAGVVLRPVTDDGLDGWRAWANPYPAPPFVVVPAWQPPPDPASLPLGHRVLLIDPGHTFGSGSHPTTRLVLGCLARHLERASSTASGSEPRGVLDVGSGSGILAVAAALLGAPAVTAIDIDGASPPTVAENASRNGVGDVVAASTTTLAELARAGDRFDLVTANLLAPIVRDLGADLRQVLAPGGTLVVSGLLTDQVDEVLDGLVGMQPVQTVSEDGWAAVVLRRRSEPTEV